MPTVMVNVRGSEWSAHFIAPDGKTRIGPWLLLDSEERVLELLGRGVVTDEHMAEYHSSILRWNLASTHMVLNDAQYADLLRAGLRDPRNGYEKRKAREAGMLRRGIGEVQGGT